MSSKYVREKINTLLSSSFPTIDVIDSTNIGISRGANTDLFLVTKFVGADEDIETIGQTGNNLYRESGIFEVNVVVESGIGSDIALTKIEEIRNIFRGKQLDGINYLDCSPSNEGNITVTDGQFYSFVTIIDYYYNFHS